MKETVTVILPFKNEEKLIGKSIESLLAQTYTDLDILCIDDYSDDKSVEVIQSYNDERIRVYSKKQEAPGISVSRNLGVDMARGTYVVFHDGDDEALPTKIEKQVALIRKYGTNTIAGTWIHKIIDGEAHPMTLPVTNEEIVKGFQRKFNRATIVAGIICARREVFLENRYNENQKYQQDWDFLLRLFESGKYQFHNVPEYLYRYLIAPPGPSFRGLDPPEHDGQIEPIEPETQSAEFTSLEEMYREIRKQP
ncbi:MAG: glycosyltransferase family A protein [Bacteroidales bacterium]